MSRTAGSSLSTPKVLFYDLETAPIRAWVWQQWEANVIRTDHDWYILSVAYKWAHEKTVKTIALPDFPRYDKDRENDKALVQELWRLFDEADIIIAHNGDRFDQRKSFTRFIIHGLAPPSPSKSVDTLKIARSKFGFSSNKLDDLGAYLGLGRKLPHTGAHLWFGCMGGDPKSWQTMRRYNAQDVRLLERVYYRMRPWATNHPNMNLYTGKDDCPSCQSKEVQRRGEMVKQATRKQRFQCQSCGHWFSKSKAA